MNLAWSNKGLRDYKLETIVRGQLAEMAVALESAFWPSELTNVNVLLEMYLDTGTGQLPKAKLAQLLEAAARLTPHESGLTKKAECRRRMSSIGVLASIATTRFIQAGNKLAELEAWVMCLACIWGISQKNNLSVKEWHSAASLIEMFIRGLLEELALEAKANPSLVVGHPLSDRVVRGTRITHLVALFSLLWLWRRKDNITEDELDEYLRDFCIQKFNSLAFWGEGVTPQILAAYWGLGSMAPYVDTDGLLLNAIDLITHFNGNRRSGTLYSPYYGYEEILLRKLGQEDDAIPESFRHRSHAIESFLALVVRQNLKQGLRLRWPDVSNVMFTHFDPDKVWHIFRWRNDDSGRLVMRMPSERQSWSALRESYLSVNRNSIPRVIRDYPILAALFLVCYPHRMQPSWVCWLDEVIR